MNKDEIMVMLNNNIKYKYRYELLHDIINRLSYPEKYVFTDEWFSGDGDI